MKKIDFKNNMIARYTVTFIAFLFIFGSAFIGSIGDLGKSAVNVIGIFIGSLILWLTIGIDWPSLLCIFALGLVPEIGFNTVFSSSFGNTTYIFLLFTFICTYALSQTPFVKRIAIWFVSTKLAKKGPWYFICSFFAAVIFVGCFMSPSVLFVVLLPILEEILTIAKVEKGEKVGNMLMMGMAFTVSISSGMTTIAHVFPTLAMGALGGDISHGSYMLMAIPVGIVITVLMILIFRFILRPDVSKFDGIDISSMKAELPKFSAKEGVCLSVFFAVVLLWILPGILQNYLEFFKSIKKLGDAVPPLMGVLALSVITVDKKPVVNITEAMKNGIPWAGMIMCAGTLALSSALTNNAIGIKAFLESGLTEPLKNVSPILLLVLFVVWAGVQTNVSSNMVTATLVATVASSVLSGVTGVNVTAVVCLIGMMASFAFATPPSMPHIAIATGSGWSDTKSMLVYGGLLLVVSVVIACVVGYPLGVLLF